MNIGNGTVFGYWVSTAETRTIKGRTSMLCRCKCGTEKYVRKSKLLDGSSKSCGCYRRELNTTHGQTGKAVREKSHEYWIWNAMVQRCTNANDAGYKNYGGRGITVCERWGKFENFFADMGARPSDQHSIDRDDNEKGYSPENCAWVDRNTQARNKRNNRFIVCGDDRKTLAEWAHICGVNHSTIIARIKSGWDICRAVKAPKNSTYHKHDLL